MNKVFKMNKIFKILKGKDIIFLIISLVVFFFILEDIVEGGFIRGDIFVIQNIDFFRKDILTNIFKFITNLGGAYTLIILSFVLLIVRKNKKIYLTVALNLVSVTVLNLLIKEIVRRPRPPEEVRLIAEGYYSFPSGHAMIATAFYGYLMYLGYKKIKNKNLKWSLIVILSILIFLICLSRLYLGVHYLSDVIGGVCFSIAYLILYIIFVNKK